MESIPRLTTLVTLWPLLPSVLQIEVDHPIYLIQNDERMKDEKLTSLILVCIVSDQNAILDYNLNLELSYYLLKIRLITWK